MIRWLAAVFLALALPAAGAAEIVIVNMDGPGEGLNDPTLQTSPGDNPGMTLGALRRNAVAYAAAVLASRLQVTVPIRIAVDFRSLYCDDSSALIGSGGTNYSVGNFPQAPLTDVQYPIALANQLAGRRLDIHGEPYADMAVVFTSALDSQPRCLGGSAWYYGLDGNTPTGDLNFLTTAVHEMIHGLGFQSFVILQDNRFGKKGQFLQAANGQRRPDIYSYHIRDLSYSGITYWPDLSVAARARSIARTGDLVWAARGSSNTPNAVAELENGARSGQILLFAPDPVEPGSSISHFSDTVVPSQLMGPRDNEARVRDGLGLAMCILADIGWSLDTAACPDNGTVMAPEADYASVRFVWANGEGGIVGDAGGGSSRSSGGGCTVNATAAFDPVLILLAVLAMGVLGRRRRTPCAD